MKGVNGQETEVSCGSVDSCRKRCSNPNIGMTFGERLTTVRPV